MWQERGWSPDRTSSPPPARPGPRSSPGRNNLPKTQSPSGHLPWLEIQNHQQPNVPKNNIPSLSPTTLCTEPRSFSHAASTWRGFISSSDPPGGFTPPPPARWVSLLWRWGACPHHSHHGSRSLPLPLLPGVAVADAPSPACTSPSALLSCVNAPCAPSRGGRLL